MRYLSTRGGIRDLTFTDAVLTGLAPDGGLLVPETVPNVAEHLDQWRSLDFIGLAKAMLPLFIDDIDRATLDRLIDQAYATFACDDATDAAGTRESSAEQVAVLRALGNTNVLELFHGPTLAFKDVALQLLGRLFEHMLGERGLHLNILGATSGDTGSAAIAGVRGQANIDIFILFPKGRVSELQELQMTTVPDANVHCLAVEGSFDDCQNLMKTIFADLDFKQKYSLGAVNSVNWARVLAQIVYYGYASLRFDRAPSFCVPTGNFGNAFAAWMARKMGFPINKLVVATNDNDILARFFQTGVYARGDVHYTLSPAMDIQVASNFERFLYYHFDCDSNRLKAFMDTFAATGEASIGGPPADAGGAVFVSTAVNRQETSAAIKAAWTGHGYVADPHTAVGLAAASRFTDLDPVVCIATAHPAKFPESVDAAIGKPVARHPTLDALKGKPARVTTVAADIEAIKAVVREHASHG